MRLYRLSLLIVYLVSFAAVAHLTAEGFTYYSSPLIERPRHEMYWSLKPGGDRGILYGIAGAAMMILMLAYSLRKRIPWMRRWGAVGVWLDIHIYLGIFGPLLAILHTSFKVSGIVALSFWSMIIVALSGFVGRFLHLRLPERAAGEWTARDRRVMRAFHVWHVFHKPFAAIMYFFLILHVVVAWYTGYAWRWG